MARYLVYTSPARGHLYPVVPTFEELRRRGHEVVVRTLASEVGLLGGLGFEAESIDPAIERKEHADWQARTPIGALQDNLNVFFERARLDGPDLRRAIEEERPEALLIMLRAPLMLYMTSEPFEYPRSDWPPSVRMVGPGIWDPPAKAPEWLQRISRPLVLVTCSTEFQNDGKLVRMALEALAGEDVEVVVTTAGVDPSSFTPPPNARVERFVPHSPVVERASCVVCHGGMGITQKALAAGVPVCVVPFGRDQFDVARHVQVADAGTRLPASRLRPDRLRKAVREAMEKKAGAERIAATFAADGGPRMAAEALEELLRNRVSGPTGRI
jgi:MGT family glycosyltransferase